MATKYAVELARRKARRETMHEVEIKPMVPPEVRICFDYGHTGRGDFDRRAAVVEEGMDEYPRLGIF